MKDKNIVEMEVRSLIESSLTMLKETKRLKEDYSQNEFSRGRYEGIMMMGKDSIENFIRFADRIGINLKKESDLAYEFLNNFCRDHCKDKKERAEFFSALSAYLEAELELEKEVGK